jgi:hypothetical protein
MNKGGFSWEKLIGISRVKSNISRSIGIPLTKNGRNQKIGSLITNVLATISKLINSK